MFFYVLHSISARSVDDASDRGQLTLLTSKFTKRGKKLVWWEVKDPDWDNFLGSNVIFVL
jgi:hypothetical protein